MATYYITWNGGVFTLPPGGKCATITTGRDPVLEALSEDAPIEITGYNDPHRIFPSLDLRAIGEKIRRMEMA